MDLQSPDLDPLLRPLAGFEGPHLVGPDAQEWKIEIVENPTQWWFAELPEGALVFAENGYGDHLFLRPDADGVFAFWHEGPEINEYCATVAELRPDRGRPPSGHPEIRYRGTDEAVRLGDRVAIRYWLVFKGSGEVTYVPGVSPRKPALERDGLAWVRVCLDDGTILETIVMPDGCLKRSVRLLCRPG